MTTTGNVLRNAEARSCNHCCEKAIRIAYSESVFVALVIQHAKRTRHVILSVAPQVLQHFYTLYHKRHDFRKNVTEHKMCVLIFPTTFVWKFSHSKKNSARYYQYCTLVLKYLLFLSHFNECWISLTDFSKNTQIKNFMKIRPVGSELFHADGWRGRRDEANSRFPQFCESV